MRWRWRPRTKRPDDWATTQNALGVALRLLGGAAGQRDWRTPSWPSALPWKCAPASASPLHGRSPGAVSARRSGYSASAKWAQRGWRKRRRPSSWPWRCAFASACRLIGQGRRVCLGVALTVLGKREAGTARLEEAVTVCRLAVEERTRQREPLLWARLQSNLGKALQALGAREAGTLRLEEAAEVFRLAMEEWTRERVPPNWAETQTNLGNTLRMLGEREAGTVPRATATGRGS